MYINLSYILLGIFSIFILYNYLVLSTLFCDKNEFYKLIDKVVTKIIYIKMNIKEIYNYLYKSYYEPYFVEKGFNCFFHDVDAYTLTLDGYIWAYPGMPAAGKKCIAVMPEYVSDVMKYDLSEYFGVCSDYVLSISEAVS
jgi:hypothetical protein